VIRGIRRRDTFVALRSQGVRVRRRGLVVVYVPIDSDATEVAFAISRRAATAVRRNRCRRRLRAALVELDRRGALPHGAYLVSVSVEAVAAPQAELASGLDDVLAQLAARPR
jgi:ribonuclease P protein component